MISDFYRKELAKYIDARDNGLKEKDLVICAIGNRYVIRSLDGEVYDDNRGRGFDSVRKAMIVYSKNYKPDGWGYVLDRTAFPNEIRMYL